MTDLQSRRENDSHAACQEREFEAWRQAHDEMERRQKTDRRLHFWKGQAIVGYTVIGVQLVRWLLERWG